MTGSDIAVVLSVPKEDISELNNILNELEEEGVILLNKRKKYVSTKNQGYITTEFSGSGKEYGFARMENGEDLFIPPDKTRGALDGDKVLIRITEKPHGPKSGEAEVVKIINRANSIRSLAVHITPESPMAYPPGSLST